MSAYLDRPHRTLAEARAARVGEIARQIAEEDRGEFTATPKEPYCSGCGVTVDRVALAALIEAALRAVAAEFEEGTQP